MEFRRLRSFLIGPIAVAALVVAPTAALSQGLKLRIVSTTDLHTHVVDYDYYRDAVETTRSASPARRA